MYPMPGNRLVKRPKRGSECAMYVLRPLKSNRAARAIGGSARDPGNEKQTYDPSRFMRFQVPRVAGLGVVRST